MCNSAYALMHIKVSKLDKISKDILKVLEDHPSGLSINELSKKSKYHRNTISPRLTDLSEEGNVKIKKTGRAKVYYLKDHAMIAEGGRMSSKNKNIQVGQGLSKDDDPYTAGKEAATSAIKDYAGKDKPDIGFVFCSGAKYGKDDKSINEFVKGISEVLEDITWVGCTTAGEISKEGLTKGSAVVTVLQSNMMYWGIASEKINSKNHKKTGIKVAKKAINNLKIDKIIHSYSQYQFLKKAKTSEMVTSDPYNMIILTQGAGVEGGDYATPVRLIKGIKEVIKSNPIVGGLAGDDERLLKNYQFHNGNYSEDKVIAISLVTSHRTSFRMAHGFKPNGKIMLATEVKDNVVSKFNNKPAAEEYARMLGISYEQLFPRYLRIARKLNLEKGLLKLLIKQGKNPFKESPLGKYSTKNPLGFFDEFLNIRIKLPIDFLKNKEMVFLNEIPNNSALQFLKYDSKDVYTSSINTIKTLRKDIKNKGIIFAFECFQRCSSFESEIKDSSKEYSVGGDVMPIGFATYGEIGTSKQGVSGGQTVTLTTMGISDQIISKK